MSAISNIKTAWQTYQAKNAKRKKNPDWSRIEEPENFLKNVFLTVITLIITGVLGTLAINILSSPDDALVRFANFLHNYGDDFNKVYAAFSVALMAMVNLLVLIIFIMFGHSDEDDVVEMLSDFDAAFNERLAETEHILGEKLDDLYVQIGDMCVGPIEEEK
jgi:uncharacterized membrane protein